MGNLPNEKMEGLLKAAWAVRENAYAPYSNFKVGSAVMGGSGKIYVGCNVENASFGLTICAERNAIAQAVAAGEKEILAIAVVSDAPDPASPCGACRQVMVEFAGNIPVILENTNGKRIVRALHEFMPYRFDLEKGIQQ